MKTLRHFFAHPTPECRATEDMLAEADTCGHIRPSTGCRELYTGRMISLLVALLLTGCVPVTPESLPAPLLVTLPVVTIAPPTPTPAASVQSPTTPTIPPTPVPQSQGIGATHRLWEWDQVARPTALAATNNRLAVLAADGRFLWITAETGRLEGSAYLWTGILQGDSWGEVYTDGIMALAAVREMSINPKTGLADSRARLIAFDAQANEVWSLPQLDSQHFYSAAMASGPGIVVVGKWPHGFNDNELAAYELFTGQRLWRVRDGDNGFQQIVHDGTRLYVLFNNHDGTGEVGCYDLRTGDPLWRWIDPAVKQPDLIALGEGSLYVMTVSETLALDTTTGTVKWAVAFSAAPEAGLGASGNLLYMAPAPSAQTGFRPGVVGLDAASGELAWQSLGGLLADPLAVSVEALWTVVKDYDSGQVYLSGLELDSGLEKVRVPVSMDPEVLYQLVALDRRVYVLGDTLQAFGY